MPPSSTIFFNLLHIAYICCVDHPLHYISFCSPWTANKYFLFVYEGFKPSRQLLAKLMCNVAMWGLIYWSFFRFVVVDEAHAYRGVFGCHTALILRRLRRLCNHGKVLNLCELAGFKHLFVGLDKCGFENNGGCTWRLFTFTRHLRTSVLFERMTSLRSLFESASISWGVFTLLGRPCMGRKHRQIAYTKMKSRLTINGQIKWMQTGNGSSKHLMSCAWCTSAWLNLINVSSIINKPFEQAIIVSVKFL